MAGVAQVQPLTFGHDFFHHSCNQNSQTNHKCNTTLCNITQKRIQLKTGGVALIQKEQVVPNIYEY
jgi:hypothetical protein